MIVGLGLDIVEFDKIKKVLNKNEISFVKKILSDKEQAIYSTLIEKRKIEFIAGRFACKEAFSKAMGTGINNEYLTMEDITILNDDKGKPILLTDKLNEDEVCHVTITHSDNYAVANVIIEKI